MQKYWSGTVTRNTVMRRAADYLDLIKPNIAALDYTAAVRICGALNLQIHTSFSSGPNRNVTTVCRKKTFFGVCVDRSQSLFYFVPQESHSQAGSTNLPKRDYFSIPFVLRLQVGVKAADQQQILVTRSQLLLKHISCERAKQHCAMACVSYN